MKKLVYGLIFLCLAALSPSGHAGQMSLLGAGSGVFVAPPTPLLDTLAATASHAYGTRLLRAAYAGSALQVARTSDSTTQNIGFDGSNNLNTSTLATFCAATTCGVSLWYDQIGSANCVNATVATQPRLYFSGAVEVINSHAAPRWGVVTTSGCLVTQSLLAQPNTIAIAGRHNSQTAGHWTDGTTSTPRSLIGVSGTTLYAIFAGTNLTGGTLDTSTHALIGIFNGASSSLILDGTAIISGNAGTQGLNNFDIGDANGGSGIVSMNGNIGEFITFNSSISGADQVLIRTSWQSYWGTP